MEDASTRRRRDGRTTDTRARIEAVALELFIAKGFTHTTLQDIADRLELTKAALYYHFPSKAALIKSLVRPVIDDIDAFLDEAERVALEPRALLEGFFDLNYTHRTVLLAITSDPSALSVADAEGWVPRLASQAQRLLAGPNPGPEQRIRALMAVNGLSRAATLLADIDHDELRATAVDVALDTLEAPESRRAQGSHRPRPNS